MVDGWAGGPRRVCLCCGCAALPPRSTEFATCPVCRWEDEVSDPDAPSHLNGELTATQARAHVERIGTWAPEVAHLGRPPTPAEVGPATSAGLAATAGQAVYERFPGREVRPGTVVGWVARGIEHRPPWYGFLRTATGRCAALTVDWQQPGRAPTVRTHDELGPGRTEHYLVHLPPPLALWSETPRLDRILSRLADDVDRRPLAPGDEQLDREPGPGVLLEPEPPPAPPGWRSQVAVVTTQHLSAMGGGGGRTVVQATPLSPIAVHAALLAELGGWLHDPRGSFRTGEVVDGWRRTRSIDLHPVEDPRAGAEVAGGEIPAGTACLLVESSLATPDQAGPPPRSRWRRPSRRRRGAGP